MADENKQTFPTIPTGSFWKLRKQFQKSIPTTITPNYLATVLDMTELAAKVNILPGLKILKIVDADGKVNTNLVAKFRDDEQYAEFAKETLTDIYPEELLELFSEPPVDKAKVRQWFQRKQRVGESASKKYAALFAALSDGTPQILTEAAANTVQSKPLKATKAATPINKKTSVITPPAVVAEMPTTLEGGKKVINPEVNINIQIHISGEATSDQIDKIFESMSKHLFPNLASK